MARQRQYDDPISIPFTFEVKDRIVQLAEDHNVAQADVVRMCATTEQLDKIEKALKGESA